MKRSTIPNEPPRMDRPITYPLPMRSDFVGLVVLPANMSAAEAEHVCRIIRSLARPSLPQEQETQS